MDVVISKSDRSDKKMKAVINNKKTIHFGAKGYEDFTTHKDKDRKQRYIDRHKKREDWGASGVDTAGFYSRWVTWHKPTIQESVKELKKEFEI